VRRFLLKSSATGIPQYFGAKATSVTDATQGPCAHDTLHVSAAFAQVASCASASICQARAISSNCVFLVRSRVRAAILRHSTTRSSYLSIHPNSLPSEPCSGEFVPSGVVQNRNRLLPRLPGPHQLAHTFPDLGVAWSRGASIFGSTREFGDAGPIAKRRPVWRSQRR
jgi:hypothetical protein